MFGVLAELAKPAVLPAFDLLYIIAMDLMCAGCFTKSGYSLSVYTHIYIYTHLHAYLHTYFGSRLGPWHDPWVGPMSPGLPNVHNRYGPSLSRVGPPFLAGGHGKTGENSQREHDG